MTPADPELQQLIEAYLDGEATPEVRQALEARLRLDPVARKAYWDAATLHGALTTWGGEQAGRELARASLPKFPGAAAAPARTAWRRWTLAGLAAAAALVACLSLPRSLPVGQVALERNAVWAAGAAPRDGAIVPGRYRLEEGMARFDLRSGAAITVAAPAEFSVESGQMLTLTRGRLASRMMRSGGTVLVHAPGLQVRDLGTAFGVDASHPEHTLVSVFDGLVAVTSPGVTGPRLTLTEGQSVIGRREQPDAIERTNFTPDAFQDVWPLTVGIDEASDLVDYLPPGPLQRPLREFRSNDRLFLFPERQGIVTANPVPLDISPAAPNWPTAPASPYPLAAGAHVNSYLVFYQPDPAGLGRTHHLSGKIVFRKRVLGMICSDQWLDATDSALGSAGVDYSTPGQNRGLEEADKDNYRGARLPHDSVQIGPDGHTVTFDFYVSDEREQLRILAASD